MIQISSRLAWGLLLVALGILMLMQNLFGFFGFFINDIVWAIVFTGGGMAFLLAYLTDRSRWWLVIPGFMLILLGAQVGMHTLFPWFARAWGGSLFLGGIGAGFLAAYFVNRQNWWALIPAGVLFTLALISGMSQTMFRSATGGIFFLGLAATFLLLFLLPTAKGRMRWPLYPAAALFVFGLFILAALTSILAFFWPIALILIGVFLLLPNIRSRTSA